MSGYGDFITKLARDLTDFLRGRPDVDLEAIDHLTPLPTFDLGKARTNKRIYSRSGCRIFVTSLTGTAHIRTRPSGEKYSLFKGSLSFPFKELYLTNTAQAGKTLSVVIGLQSFVDLDAQPEFSSTGLATEATLALIKAKTDFLAALDVALSTRAKEAGGNLAAIAGKDFATQTTLALIKAKTDNLTDLASQTTLALIKAKTDNLNVALSTVATQTTLNLVKLKTDHLDIAISALRDAITDGASPKDLKDLWDKLVLIEAELAYFPDRGSSPVTYAVVMTDANVEYSQVLPNTTKQLTFFVRGGGLSFNYAWIPGKCGGVPPTDPYTEVPENGIVFLDKLAFDSKILYFACATAGKVMQVEVLT